MFESLKKMFGEPEKPKMALELQKQIAISLAQDALARFEMWQNDVRAGTYATGRLEFNIFESLAEDIKKAAADFSPEMIEHLRMRGGADPTADERQVIKQYIKSKLQPKLTELKNEMLAQQRVLEEADRPLAARILEANAYEASQLSDISAMLRSRPEQHDILTGAVNMGIYAGTERTPAILVDGGQKREEEYEEQARLSTILENVKTKAKKKYAEIQSHSPASGKQSAVFMTAIVKGEVIEAAKQALPLQQIPETHADWIGKKVPLQHLLAEKIGTPSAQSLLAGFLLEALAREGFISHEPVRVRHGASKNGGHAFVTFGHDIIDPSVSLESLDARGQYPDEFYRY